MEEFVYTLGKGGLKRLSEHPELPKGTIVYAFGAGMDFPEIKGSNNQANIINL